jgi:hypothetical protein
LEQQVDLAAVYKRFSELSSAGDYAAALVEGKKLAPAVQGTVRAHPHQLCGRFRDLAAVHERLGNPGEARI